MDIEAFLVLSECPWPPARALKALPTVVKEVWAHDPPEPLLGQDLPVSRLEALLLPEKACLQGCHNMQLRQSRIAAMTRSWGITAVRCKRELQLGQAITSTANTFRSSCAHGTQRRQMVLQLRGSAHLRTTTRHAAMKKGPVESGCCRFSALSRFSRFHAFCPCGAPPQWRGICGT